MTANPTADPILLARLTSPETAALLPRLELVLVPVGAHEQHGPGIAVSCDTVSADSLCRGAAAILGGRVAVAPPVPWGVSWHHLAFAGTISLRQETLVAILRDIAGSLAAQGVRRVLFVNGHGGNGAAVATAVDQIAQEQPGLLAASVFGYALLVAVGREVLPADAIGHAGADEAAIVWAADPGLVRPEAFAAADLTGELAESDRLLRAHGGSVGRPYHRVTRNGATGDSRHATEEVGRALRDGAAARLAEIVETLLREDATRQ